MTDWPIQFLRPLWLAGMLPLAALAVYLLRSNQNVSPWEQVVDPALQPYVIDKPTRTRLWGRWLVLLGWLFTLLLLSGPVWQQQEVPVYQGQRAQVVLFDLSYSMTSVDIKPSRLTRARFKLSDLLKNAKGLQIALIAFAERPYVVSPLSDDAKTILAFVASLSPDIMPAQGSRVDLAIEKGLDLLEQASITQGQLVLITDSEVTAKGIAAASSVTASGHKLSIIGVGTEEGLPLRGLDGRYIQDAKGGIVVPQLDKSALNTMARSGGGVYVDISSGAADLDAIKAVQDTLQIEADTDEQQTSQYWVEFSPYGLLLLLLAVLLFFRRGVLT